ncbi:hypothetical protein TNCV_2677731 [Trichonephila clavipes]|nr:hypothetical protein TNCV_2677731 [Trichonephila clavipes]
MALHIQACGFNPDSSQWIFMMRHSTVSMSNNYLACKEFLECLFGLSTVCVFYNQELKIDELIEMHEQEQDNEELESLEPSSIRRSNDGREFVGKPHFN